MEVCREGCVKECVREVSEDKKQKLSKKARKGKIKRKCKTFVEKRVDLEKGKGKVTKEKGNIGREKFLLMNKKSPKWTWSQMKL